MNKLLVLLMTFLTTGAAYSSQFIIIIPSAGIKNPQIRICRQAGGYFNAHYIANDNVGFCSFGSALIGANDLVLVQQGLRTAAVSTFLNNLGESIASCTEVGASDNVSPTISEIVCRFSDDSWISLETLSAGLHSPSNSQLVHALLELR